jgi:YVTN family beta-propeller protein
VKLALAAAALVAGTASAASTPAAKLDPGIQPFGAVASNGALWVTLSGEGKLAQVDPASNRVLGRVKVGASPFAVAAGAGSLWVANADAGTVSRVSPVKRKVVKTIRVGFRPYDVAFGGGAVWVANLSSGTVSRISPKTNRVVKTIRAGTEPNGLVYAFGAVWVGDRLGNALLEISPARNKVVARLALSKPDWVTPDDSALWVSEETGSIAKVDPASLTLLGRVAVGANPLHTAVVGGDLWVPNIDDSTISVVARGTAIVRDTFPGPAGAIAIAFAAGAAWVSGSGGTELWRFPSG